MTYGWLGLQSRQQRKPDGKVRALMADRWGMRTDRPFTVRQRRLLCYQDGFGSRGRNDWNSGDLPAPWAEGDLIWIPEDRQHERLHSLGWGYFVVSAGFSIDEGDAWYFRVSNGGDRNSDRLHVAYAGRASVGFSEDLNWMEGWELVESADPGGLAIRRQMIDDGWKLNAVDRCPTCEAVLDHAL